MQSDKPVAPNDVIMRLLVMAQDLILSPKRKARVALRSKKRTMIEKALLDETSSKNEPASPPTSVKITSLSSCRLSNFASS